MHPRTERQLQEVAARIAARAADLQRETVERDRLIVEAYMEGAPLRDIARAAGISHPRVLTIVRRAQQA